MLETSRRLLTRCNSGVAPRRAQVVPGRCRKLCPVSSRKRSVRPSRRAFFFERDPLPPRPGGDGGLVTLPGPGRRALDGEAIRPQRPLRVAEVIAHAELPPDQYRNALQGPALSSKARCRCTACQEPAKPCPGAAVEARWSPGPRSGPQPAPALLPQDASPATDAGAADAEMAGDGRLRHLPLPQQPCRRQAPLLQLARRQVRRTLLAAAHCHHPRQCSPVATLYQPDLALTLLCLF